MTTTTDAARHLVGHPGPYQVPDRYGLEFQDVGRSGTWYAGSGPSDFRWSSSALVWLFD